MVVPVLSPDNFIAYQNFLGIKSGSSEKHKQGILPQFYADRFGWEDMTDKVIKAYNLFLKMKKIYRYLCTKLWRSRSNKLLWEKI
jgi:hypothetical protein